MLKNQHRFAGPIEFATDRLASPCVYLAIALRGFGAVMVVGFIASLIASVPVKAQDDVATIKLPTRVDPSTEQLLIAVDAAGGRLWCSLDTGFSALVAVDRAK